MDATIHIGRFNRLKIDRDTEPGLFLVSGDERAVLLPNRYVTPSMKIGDELDVFVYTDSEDRPVATTQKPFAIVGEFGYFEVVDTARHGAFVDWGLPKDLFVPKTATKKELSRGDRVVLRVTYDENSGRLIGDRSIAPYLGLEVEDLKKLDEVKLLVWAKTPLGFKVIVNDRYEGLIFQNEIFENINVGDEKKGFVKNIRSDGKLDISLQAIGKQRADDASQKIVSLLKEHKGFLPYNYKSEAEEISRTFGLSKKNFKSALTKLQDEKLITIDEKGIRALK